MTVVSFRSAMFSKKAVSFSFSGTVSSWSWSSCLSSVVPLLSNHSKVRLPGVTDSRLTGITPSRGPLAKAIWVSSRVMVRVSLSMV